MTTTTMAGPATASRSMTSLTKWTVGSLVVGTLLLIYMQVFLVRAFMPPIALMFGIPALIFAALVAGIRRRWAPLLGSLYWLLFIAANAPYLGHDLARPEFFSNFSFSVVLLLPALAGLAAGLAATVKNYRAGEPSAVGQSVPRWFSVGFTATAALGLGAILAAAIAQAGANVGVSPETLASLPAVTAVDYRFGQSELRAKVGETVALRLDNQDASGHSFDIDEYDLHVSMPPGQDALALFKADTAGTYTFYCSVPGHREAGMVGTLVVEP